MKLFEIARQPREIILVSGNIASGKGYYARAKFPGYAHIEVSSIVKSLINSSERSELGKTGGLDQRILHILIEQINTYDKVVVDGIRQISILKGLQDHFGNEIKKIIWLDVPEQVRRERFGQRKSTKDNMDFDTSMQSDRGLGIDDVENYIRGNHDVDQN